MTKLHGLVKKGWGSELIWTSTESYCGKLMNFDQGARFSMHFHSKKEESWYVLSGKFIVKVIDTSNADVNEHELNVGDVWHNKPLSPHQLICIEAGTIIEVSMPDSVEDNYRVAKGDSQQ
jgi:quercetin dioxygenase-like cupin family protein